MRPVTVNNGKAFGYANWYTFFCPNCNAQITRQETENKPCKCGCKIEWAMDKNQK